MVSQLARFARAFSSTTLPAARDLLTGIAANRPPSYARRFVSPLPPVPNTLRAFRDDSLTLDRATMLRRYFDPRVNAIPPPWQRYASGQSDKGRRFIDPAANQFIVDLFHTIATQSQNELGLAITLAGYDLYHGHLFSTVVDREQRFLGILFHAKEYPREYPYFGPPQRDPREGTTLSIAQPDFHLRNFLWVVEPHALFLIDPKGVGFDATLLDSEEFFTVSPEAFNSTSIADVNYFPGAVSSSKRSSENLFVAPVGGFSP